MWPCANWWGGGWEVVLGCYEGLHCPKANSKSMAGQKTMEKEKDSLLLSEQRALIFILPWALKDLII